MVERVPIEMKATKKNRAYLFAKRDKAGHLLTLADVRASPRRTKAPKRKP